MADAERIPDGPPRRAWFEGIVEGRIGDETALRSASGHLSRLDVVSADLSVDGGRFTWMPDDAPLPGQRLTTERQQALLEALDALVASARDPAQVESTLRCTMRYDDVVVETWFVVQQGRMRPVSRVRPAGDADRVPEAPPRRRIGGPRAAIVAALVALIAGLIVWDSGLVDQLLGPDLAELAVDTGPFHGDVAVGFDSGLGTFAVNVSRGPGYPATVSDVERRLEAAGTTAERAAIGAVASGGTIWVQLRDEEGEWLDAAPCSLRPLLENGRAHVTLRYRMHLSRVLLALDPGAPVD